jgi:hypothetical protein
MSLLPTSICSAATLCIVTVILSGSPVGASAGAEDVAGAEGVVEAEDVTGGGSRCVYQLGVLLRGVQGSSYEVPWSEFECVRIARIVVIFGGYGTGVTPDDFEHW